MTGKVLVLIGASMSQLSTETGQSDQGLESSEAEPVRPALTFESITFSDGQTLQFEPDEIVVFVGPNNAGKSAALRELQNFINRTAAQTVVSGATLKKTGDANSFRSYLEKYALKISPSSNLSYAGIGYNINHSNLRWFDNPTDRHPVSAFFCGRIATETRLTGSDPAGSISLFRDAPSHPIHLLLMDNGLAKSISELFRRAFGRDLIVLRAGGSSFPLYVGDKPALTAGEDELGPRFVEELFSSAKPLQEQGDGMRSFATVLLHVLASENHSVQFLDEPEAFLHPPQARLLGEFIAKERRSKSQLFIATHSTDILDGLMAGSVEKIRIVRIQRSEDINYIKELSKEKTIAVARDTLTRYSGVFRGIFYKHVIIAESDSDCMFYSAVLDLPSVSGGQHPDVPFIHAAGKHRMAQMAETLRALDVPVSVVADIDVLSDDANLRELFEKLGGDWAEVSGHWTAVKTAVETLRAPLTAEQVKAQILAELETTGGPQPFPKPSERKIKLVFKSLSPWDAVKQAGRSAIKGAQAVRHFDTLLNKCGAVGLWLVPVGELEGFCRSAEGSHGPGFVQKVLEERDLETDPELEDARRFVRTLWQSASSR